jgi:EAL domain-containing protein (putative c-di-GMP-specific phosphodiesterase class I)/GAF domain-containing protein
MASLARLHARRDSIPADLSAGERFTRALLSLTRTVWSPQCTFASAIEAIAEAAAEALVTDRVSVWTYHRDSSELTCQFCCRTDGSERRAPASDSLSLHDFNYMDSLDDVRTLDAEALDASTSTARSHIALRSYLRDHRILARLDAPAFLGGELLGVICLESEVRGREWSAEERTFAASMGDYVAIAHEIARRRQAEAEAGHLRLHDAATNLPNRDYLIELVRQRMDTPLHAGEVLSVIHLRVEVGLDPCASAGDVAEEGAMALIAARLRGLAAQGIALARVKSNGFALALARNEALGNSVSLAQACLAAIRGMDWNSRSMEPRAVAGVAFADRTGSSDPRELLRKAEEAAEHANGGEAYGYEVFDIAHHEGLVRRVRLERALAEALESGKLEVHYQPEYDAAEHAWVGAEALLRWSDAGRLVCAGDFIDVAETSGLIVPIGVWVMRRACLDAMCWSTPGDRQPVVRVNVSARQFEDDRLVAHVAASLAASGLPAGRLCLELTETTLMGDIEKATGVLRELKSLGVQLALDDFGTGFAPLVYLKRFPVDVLKIDRSFVHGLPGDRVDAAIVMAVASLAAALRIEVVAEGVETEEQQRALGAAGVHKMQGWRFARAMDQSAVCRTLGCAAPQL